MKKIVFAAVTALSVLALGGCSLFYPNWGATGLPTATSSSSATSSQTDTPTPTPTDTASSSASPTPSNLLSAEVQVVDASTDATAGTLTVIAQVNNLTETGGSCVATIKDAGVTKTYPAVRAEANASSTQCFAITIPLNGLASGSAAVQVSYSSSTAAGRSNYFAVTIP